MLKTPATTIPPLPTPKQDEQIKAMLGKSTKNREKSLYGRFERFSHN